MTRLIQSLETSGMLRTIDAALGRLLAEKSMQGGDILGLVAALASAALAHGHSCLPLAALPEFLQELAAVANARVPDELPSIDAIRTALRASNLVARDAATAAALVVDADERVYLRRYFVYEQTVAQTLASRLTDSSLIESLERFGPASLREALLRQFAKDSRTGRSMDRDQCVAALLTLRSRLLIISGGPGSGKTTTVLNLLALVVAYAQQTGAPLPRIALAAPTGKAAARLSETLRSRGDEDANAIIPDAAMTVHRLLGLAPGSRRALYDRHNPLPYDLVVIDEASMLDLALAARLCGALAPSTRLILLGDRDQLASVEAGRVFGALSHATGTAGGHSPAVAQWLRTILQQDVEVAGELTPLADAFIELRGNHRFDGQGAVGRLALALRRGDVETTMRVFDESGVEATLTPTNAAILARHVVREIVPRYAGLAGAPDANDAFAIADRFRVLCALREGPFGALAINAAIEQEMLRRGEGADTNGWYPGRLVIVGGNDYRLGLFNGDIGVALPSGTDGALEVWFRNADGSLRALPPLVLGSCEPAYALTVHKAQGSEFDDVVIVLPDRDSRVLTRELVYTAVTRARKKVDLWTNKEILENAIMRSTQRWSGLAEALRPTVTN